MSNYAKITEHIWEQLHVDTELHPDLSGPYSRDAAIEIQEVLFKELEKRDRLLGKYQVLANFLEGILASEGYFGLCEDIRELRVQWEALNNE